MRTITMSPADSVPELLESDIDNCLIIAHIKDVGLDHVAYAIKYYNLRRTLNWYGDTISGNGGLWQHLCHGNLIEFISKSWNYWIITSDTAILKIYICESIEDVIFACNESGVRNDILRYKIYKQFDIIKELKEAYPNDNN